MEERRPYSIIGNEDIQIFIFTDSIEGEELADYLEFLFAVGHFDDFDDEDLIFEPESPSEFTLCELERCILQDSSSPD